MSEGEELLELARVWEFRARIQERTRMSIMDWLTIPYSGQEIAKIVIAEELAEFAASPAVRELFARKHADGGQGPDQV